MNSITLIKNLLEKRNQMELDGYLKNVWNQVWTDDGEFNYANLRLLKAADKVKTISEMVVDFKSKNVLDIGCGNGVTLMYLRKYFDITGVGVDISDSVVKELQDNITDTKLSFYVGEHRNLQMFDANQFDIVLSFGVIEHFEEYCLAMTEARRVLKPNGQIVLIQPHLLSFGVIQEYYLRARKRWKFGKQKDFSLFYYRSLLRQTGFRDIRCLTKAPYQDMRVTKVFDSLVKTVLPFWGHYLYLVAKK